MANEGGSATGSSSGLGSQTNASAVAQTANIGRSTSVTSGAAKVFREFKWGLLTLFLLMVVVIGLVYDGGKKKKPATADLGPLPDDRASQIALDGPEPGAPPTALPQPVTPGVSANTQPNPAPIAQNDLLHEPSVPPLAPPTAPEPRPLPTTVTPPTQPAAPVAPIAPAPASGEKTYVVKGGDTLTSIASSQLPSKGGLKAILDANKDVLPNPNKLRVGMTLKIPNAVATAPVKAEKSEKADAAPAKKVDNPTIKEPAQDVHSSATEYVVQSGDTLERIARKVFNDPRKWHEIYEWNRDQLPDPGRLHVGQTLKIKGGAGTATTTVPTPPAKSGRAEIIDEPVHTPPSTVHTKGAVASSKEIKEEEPAVMSSTSGANIP